MSYFGLTIMERAIDKKIYYFKIKHMDNRKKPLSKNSRTYLQSCPRCNFPIRSDDTTCMYCHTPIQQTKKGLYLYCLRYFQQLQWRWRLKRKKSSKSIQYFKYFAFLALGIGLTLVGGYLFIVSMLSNNFSNWIISFLFLFYGIYTLKTLVYKNKSDRQ